MDLSRRPTRLDSLPLATVVVLAVGMVLWAAGGPGGFGRASLAAEGEDGSVARLDEPPQTPWGDRSLGELLERVFDPAGRTEAHAPGEEQEDDTPPDAQDGPGGPPRHFVITGSDGELLGEGFVRDGVPEGRWIFRHGNGRRRADGSFHAGEPEGRWLAWHADGSPSASIEYGDDGVPDGLRVEWWPSGSKRFEGAYLNGLREGLWRRWHENGVLRSVGHYHQGLRVGKWDEWHSNTRPASVAEYVTGRRHGVWRSWYAHGGLTESGWFQDGLREGMWFFNDPDGERDRRTGYYAKGIRIRD